MKIYLLVSVDICFVDMFGNVQGTYRLDRLDNPRVMITRPVVVTKSMAAN